MLSVDTVGILIVTALWIVLGLASALAELGHDRSSLKDREFLPDAEPRLPLKPSPDRGTTISSTE